MRILLFCKRHYTNRDLLVDRFGRLFHLPVNWARCAEVEVIAWDYKGTNEETYEIGNVCFRSFPVRTTPRSVARAALLLRRHLLQTQPDYVVASSDILFGIVAAWGRRGTHARLIFDVYDDYRHFGINRWSGLRFMFPRACLAADGLMLASPTLQAETAIRNQNTLVVRNGYDPATFHPIEKRIARTRLGLPHDISIVAFTGSLDERFDHACVVAAMEHLNNGSPRIHLLIAGANAQGLCTEHPWATYFGLVTQSEIADIINASDVCIAPYRKTHLADTANPCKVAEYLACERPVVAADVADLREFVDHGLVLYQPSDHRELAKRIRVVLETPPRVTPVPEWTWQDLATVSLEWMTTLVGTSAPEGNS